jgi:hygromycin-B 7''-O-kinase
MLPAAATVSAFDRLLVEGRAPGSTTWQRALAAICERHGLQGPGSPGGFRPADTGSSAVFLSSAHCIKLHPPLDAYRSSCQTEVVALRRVAGALPIETPRVSAVAELEGWPYFVATRVPGVAVDEVWAELDASAGRELAAALGRAVAAMHALPVDTVALPDEWDTFVATERARCVVRERERGLDATRIAEVERFLAAGDRWDVPPHRRALLHTEIGPGHVLVERGLPTGLIDFGEAMIGHPEYDLAAVGLFVTRGDRAAFRAFSQGYGLTPDAIADARRPLRLLRHALLHRYGTLAWYLDRLDPPRGSLEDLADFWFGT